MKCPEIMKCPECEHRGMKSTAYSQGSSSTLLGCMPHYDEDGKYHDHDINTVVESFRCSNNHHFSKKILKSCWCGWKQK